MKVAVCSIAYNEEEWIERCIKQFQPFGLRHLVLLSTKPWNGSPQEPDRTEQIAKDAGAEVIIGYWETEAQQRNFGLSYLYDYDFVLIVDPDEFYTQKDIQTWLDSLDVSEPSYRVKNIKTYWKTPEYVFSPPDNHEPIVAVNPKKAVFYEHRQIRKFTDDVPEFNQPVLPIQMHHMSWVKSDKKVKEKIQSYSHADDIPLNWYEDVWLKWEPGSKTLIRPYGAEKSIAVRDPAPPDII